MATNLDNLNTAKANLITQLVNMTINPKPTYSLDGQSVSWESYFRMLTDQLARINSLIQIEGGVVELQTEGRSW